jgi:hypothetical protein
MVYDFAILGGGIIELKFLSIFAYKEKEYLEKRDYKKEV